MVCLCFCWYFNAYTITKDDSKNKYKCFELHNNIRCMKEWQILFMFTAMWSCGGLYSEVYYLSVCSFLFWEVNFTTAWKDKQKLYQLFTFTVVTSTALCSELMIFPEMHIQCTKCFILPILWDVLFQFVSTCKWGSCAYWQIFCLWRVVIFVPFPFKAKSSIGNWTLGQMVPM